MSPRLTYRLIVMAIALVVGLIRVSLHKSNDAQAEHDSDPATISQEYLDEANALMDKVKDPTPGNYLHWNVNHLHEQAFKGAQHEHTVGPVRSRKVYVTVDHDEYLGGLFDLMFKAAHDDKNAAATAALKNIADNAGFAVDGK